MPLSSSLCRPLAAAALVAFSLSAANAQQPPTPTKVRGEIESVSGDSLAVKSRSGQDVKLQLAPDIKVAGIAPTKLSDVKPGAFIGATTVPGPNGAHNAVEIHVFPEAMRGTGEGSRAWDLGPNSTMTNATVDQSVTSNDGSTVRVKYKGGEKVITVTPKTQVVTYGPADRSDLKPGAKIIAFGKTLPDGSFQTSRISVGRDGITPPM
ncbi:hypothetical protein SR870_23380 [Rhodopseudomonas palustris]|uniref:hypothetical protein n=1 Tax=Rhodopseudomonas palustris TaxID=1076 RepID=UPI002ACE6BF7|nr:hypothetical protein [Rhodopseudomonas palustris]WQG99574.1 hypothetical protein SR870_23380 [Rhodopseudomonas palustris]